MPKRTPSNSVPENLRNGAPLAAAGTQMWPGPPPAPPSEVEDTPRSDHTFHTVRDSDRKLDANHSSNPRESFIIRWIEDYLGRSEDIMGCDQGVGDLPEWPDRCGNYLFRLREERV